MACTRTFKIALAMIIAFAGFWAVNQVAEARDRGFQTIAGDGRYKNAASSHNYKRRVNLKNSRGYGKPGVSHRRPELYSKRKPSRRDYRPGYSTRRDYGRNYRRDYGGNYRRDYKRRRQLTSRRDYRPTRRLTNRRNIGNKRDFGNRRVARNGNRNLRNQNLRGAGSALAGALFVIDGNEIIAENQAERERQLGSQLRNKVSYYPRRTRSKFLHVTAEQLALGEERAARRDERMMAQMDSLDIRYYRDTEAYDARFPSIVYLDLIRR